MDSGMLVVVISSGYFPDLCRIVGSSLLGQYSSTMDHNAGVWLITLFQAVETEESFSSRW